MMTHNRICSEVLGLITQVCVLIPVFRCASVVCVCVCVCVRARACVLIAPPMHVSAYLCFAALPLVPHGGRVVRGTEGVHIERGFPAARIPEVY